MAVVFEVPVETLNEDISMENFEAWDSLGHITLMISIEEEFNITVDEDEIPNLTSVKLLVEYLEKVYV
jgi:acyl carrier protein